MPEVNIAHTQHRFGRKVCNGNPQDPCTDNIFIDPLTGLPARLRNRVDLIQTTGSAFSVGNRRLNERTNGPLIGRRLIPGFNN